MEATCVTCLSKGRRLQHVQCASVLGFHLSVAGPLCWECRAMINKMIAFQRQVKNAQQMLLLFGNSERLINVPSLTKLSCHLLYTFSNDICRKTVKKEINSETDSNDNSIDDQETAMKPFIQKGTLKLLQNPIEIKIEPRPESFKVEVEDITTEPKKVKDKRKTKKFDPEKCKIKTLSLDEVEKKRQEDMVSDRYMKNPYKCETCIVSYTNQKYLENHRFTGHSEQYHHECKICQQRFDSNHSREKHYNGHFTCFVCVQCNFSHTQYDPVLRHYREQHSIQQCEECQIIFKTHGKMRYHMRVQHNKAGVPRCQEPLCGKICKTFFALESHMKTHKKNRPRGECPICKKKIIMTHIRRHIANHDAAHKERHSKNKEKDIYYCQLCQKGFQLLNSYQYHMKYTSAHVKDVNKFECHDCGKRFCMKNQIRDHILRYHSRKADYVCEVCGRAFKTKKDRTGHRLKKHSGRKPVRDKVCEQCGKAFLNSKTLAEHMNVHTGARPFECAVCGDTFAYKAALFTHNRLKHLGMKRKKKMQ